jgi:hypothetical protein
MKQITFLFPGDLFPDNLYFIEKPKILYFEIEARANKHFPHRRKLKKLLKKFKIPLEILADRNLTQYFNHIKIEDMINKSNGYINITIYAKIGNNLMYFRTIINVNDEGKIKIEHIYNFMCDSEH